VWRQRWRSSGQQQSKEKHVLSRVDLKEAIASGQLFIEGLKEESIQPASIDLHLGDSFIAPYADKGFVLDPYSESDMDSTFKEPLWGGGGFVLASGGFILAATERVTLGNKLVAQVAGKSSVARFGIVIESAGFIDPGFDGCITLEIYNQMPFSILLTPGMPIAQLAVTRLDTPADITYAGKYNGSVGPVASRYWMNKRPGESV
jgi:dCTP deaminase